jgi:hypothetical protein
MGVSACRRVAPTASTRLLFFDAHKTPPEPVRPYAHTPINADPCPPAAQIQLQAFRRPSGTQIKDGQPGHKSPYPFSDAACAPKPKGLAVWTFENRFPFVPEGHAIVARRFICV